MANRGYLYHLPNECDEIDNLIAKLDCQERMKTLKVKEKTVLLTLSEGGISERKAAKILHLSRRYVRDLRKQALDKLRGKLEDEF